MSLFCWRCLQDYQDVVFVRSYQNLSLVGPHPQEAEIIDRVQVSHHRLGWRGDAAHHPRDLGSRGVVQRGLGHDTLTWNIFIRGFQIFFIVNYHLLQSPPSPPCVAAVSSESHQAQTSEAEKYLRWSSKLFHSQSYNWLIHHAGLVLGRVKLSDWSIKGSTTPKCIVLSRPDRSTKHKLHYSHSFINNITRLDVSDIVSSCQESPSCQYMLLGSYICCN